MKDEQVTRLQARVLHARVSGNADVLYRLRSRMTKRGVLPADPLFELVQKAEQAIGEMYVDLNVRRRESPLSVPEPQHTPWLEQKSARKRHDRR
jgi:hypothetical protein